VHTADRFSRRAHLASMVLGLLVAATVAYTGFLGGRMVFGPPQPRPSSAAALKTAQASAAVPTSSPSAAAALPRGATPQLVAKGDKLFHELPCVSCHRLNGSGGHSGPDLSHEARRHADVAWHVAHLKDPSKYKADSGMPPFSDLPASQLQALAAFLATRR
jgi:mono/diheme cytochrome c family protein